MTPGLIQLSPVFLVTEDRMVIGVLLLLVSYAMPDTPL